MWVLWITPCGVTLMNVRRVTPAARTAWPGFAAAKRARKISAQTETNAVKMRSLRTTERAVYFFFISSYGRGGGLGRVLGVGLSLGVGVGLAVGVGVAVAVAVAVGVGDGVQPPGQSDGVGVTPGVIVGVADAVDVAVAVGVGDAVGLGVGLGVVPTCTSNEPTSMRPLRIRQKTGPRWS